MSQQSCQIKEWIPVMCVEWDRPDGQTVHPKGEVAHWVGLIPVGVAGEGVQVGGGVEQKEEIVWMFRSDMACGWNVFEIAHRIVSTCAQKP